MGEAEIIERLRRIAIDPAARGLTDDVALLGDLILTHDTIAEGVHFFPFDPPASVGWKLVAVNLSDLAAKGAVPAAALLSLTLRGDGEWENAFLDGVAAACDSYRLPLVGGDTISLPAAAPRVLGLTALGRGGARVPARSGASPGDTLWLVGTVGDSAAGLAQLREDPEAVGSLVDVYRRPVPLLAAGQALAPHANAMMDVSDGLLLDSQRLAAASGCNATIELDLIPLSEPFLRQREDSLEERLFAATGGDDYALLAALPAHLDPLSLSLPSGTNIRRIGTLGLGEPPLEVRYRGRPIPLPETLGHEHHGFSASPVGNRP